MWYQDKDNNRVEAIQWNVNNLPEVVMFTEGIDLVYDTEAHLGMRGMRLTDAVISFNQDGNPKHLHMGGYFIKDRDGNISAMQQNAFEAKYTPIDNQR